MFLSAPDKIKKFLNFDEKDLLIYADPFPSKHIEIFYKGDKTGFCFPRYIDRKSFFLRDCVENHDLYKIQEIELSAHLEIKKENKRIIVFIPKKEFPDFYEEVLYYGKTFNIGVKKEKFLTLYKSYESLKNNRKIEFSSIRNGLSHPQNKLYNKQTINTLNKLFGTTNIDLTTYRHNKIFYIYFIKLLKEVDLEIHRKVSKLMKSSKKFLTEDIIFLTKN